MTFPELAGYRITALLRESSNLTTWKAEQQSLDRTVAIKVLHATPETDPAATAHLLAMAKAVARLKHNGIAQIYDVVADAPQPYVVMEYVEGASLTDMVAAKGPLTAIQAMRFGLQLAQALDHAWTQAQLVLRNLKPHDIRVNVEGQAKLTDFAMAVRIADDGDPTLHDGGHIVGTPQFISPEQARGSRALDCRTDMYALGATLYYLVTGNVPFGSGDPESIIRQQIEGQIPDPRTVVPGIPAAVCTVLTRLMMKEPVDRYASWSDVISDLNLLLKSRPLPRRPPGGGGSTITGADERTPGLLKLPAPGGRHRRHHGDDPAAPRLPSASNAVVTTLLWLALAAWFIWLGNLRMGNPLGFTRGASLPLPERPLWQPAAAPQSDRAQTALPPPPAREPAAPPTTPRTSGGSTVTPNPTAADSAFGGLPPAIGRELAQNLAAGNLLAARLNVAGPVPGLSDEQRAAWREAVAGIPETQSLVEAGLMARRGEPVSVTYLGRGRTIIPSSIVNGEMQAEFVADDGTKRPVTFSLSRFDPAEKLRWLPPAESPGDHAAACILALQAKDKASFEAHVGETGLLAPLLRAAQR